MKRLSRAVAVLVCSLGVAASAQEIGSEITPATPPPTPPASSQPNENPYAAQEAGTRPSRPSAVDSLQRSADRMSFGVRAGFQGTFTPTVSQTSVPNGAGGTTTVTVAQGTAPLLGVSFWVTDGLSIDADLGASMAALPNGNLAFGFGVAAGVSYYFRDHTKAARPFVAGKVGFRKGFSTGGDDFGLGLQVGGGAAYFFSPNFAVDARMLIGMDLGFASRGLLVIVSTVAPGLGATVFF